MKAFLNGLLKRLSAFSLGKLLPAVLLFVIGVVVIRIVMRLVSVTLNRTKMEKAAHSLIKSVVRIVLYLVLLLMALSMVGVDVTSVVALASVLTLALSLSLQNVLTNVISGFVLLTTDPFHTGDFVEIAGQSGTVVEIGLTYTKLATADNKQVSIPNSSVTAEQIINFSANGTRRVTVNVSASYDSDPQQVIDALLEVAKLPTVLADPEPFAGLESYGDSAISYVLRIWCKTEDFWQTQYEANRQVKAIFDQKGIVMTYPHLNVHIDK